MSAVLNAPATTEATQLDLTLLAGRIGAEIRGVRLSDRLDAARSSPPIKRALHRHKVLFFRGQQHLDDAAQQGFAELFGQPVDAPDRAVAGRHADPRARLAATAAAPTPGTPT